MNANDIIEKCASLCEGEFDSETRSYGRLFAERIRSLKSTPITFTPSTGAIAIEPMKGGDASDGDARSSRKARTPDTSPGVTTGASPAETVSEAMVEAALSSWHDGEWPFGGSRECDELAELNRHKMRAALEAAALAHADDGWLPIESAPKDGRIIQCWHCRHKVPIAVRWKPGFIADCPWVEATAAHAWPEEAFTHFMPLPAPPKDGRK